MALILINGISTAGKSSVAKELSARGYEAYDTEHNGISAWYNKETDKRVAEFGKMPERTNVWLNQHEWRMSIQRITEITKHTKNNIVFLCGGAANEQEVRKLCTAVIWLKTDKKTILERVTNSRDHDYGTKPHELARILEGNTQKEAEYTRISAIMIDATQPLDKVVDDIIEAVVHT